MYILRISTQKFVRALILAILVVVAAAFPVFAQSELNLTVHKTFGYNAGSKIRGTFEMRASGPTDLASVTFWIDDRMVGEVNAPPFVIQFKTSVYANGWHDLRAVGMTAGGQSIGSPSRRFEFLSADQETAGIQSIIIPMIGLVGAIVLVGMGVTFFSARGKSKSSVPLGQHREYGILGGTICPRCQRPFPLHWWSVNVSLVGRYDRCENCGKWSLVHHRPADELAQAEAAEARMDLAQLPQQPSSPEDELRQRLDESRYTDR
jgi:hypothetical protein